MNTDAAQPSDAVKLLLDCFEKLKGGKATADDYLEASRLVALPLAPEAMVARMGAVKQRNGSQWRPSSLRYFQAPLADLLKEPVPQPPKRTESPPIQPAVSAPLTEEEHAESLAALQALETPEQKRRVELVGTLEPRATFPELMRLLHDRMDESEFARRLQSARQRRKQAAGSFNHAGPDAAERAS